MLTIFATPKAFRGHFAVIQRNAIRSWTLLRPKCEIILMGNEQGTAEIASEFSLRHVPVVESNVHGTPLVSALFEKAQQLGAYNVLCYVNSDIILMSDLMRAVERVVARKKRFLMVGYRWNLDLSELLDFETDWEAKLRTRVSQAGKIGDHSAIDFFVFTRGLWGDIPHFAIGRPRWDNWILYRARSLHVPLIDASPVVMSIHQNHDYSHHPQGKAGVWDGDEALANENLASGYRFMLDDATYLLTPNKLRLTYDRKYLARHVRTLSTVYPIVRLPVRFVSRTLRLFQQLWCRIGVSH